MHSVISSFGDTGGQRTFLTDFELAAIRSLNTVCPQATVKGCSFHFDRLYIDVFNARAWRAYTTSLTLSSEGGSVVWLSYQRLQCRWCGTGSVNRQSHQTRLPAPKSLPLPLMLNKHGLTATILCHTPVSRQLASILLVVVSQSLATPPDWARRFQLNRLYVLMSIYRSAARLVGTGSVVPVVQATDGSTRFVTPPATSPRRYGDQLFFVAMAQEWRNGPRRLREHDDDDPLSLWSHYDNTGPRTTNIAEGWHNSLNKLIVSACLIRRLDCSSIGYRNASSRSSVDAFS